MEDFERVLTSVRASCDLHMAILQFIVLAHPERERVVANIRTLVAGLSDKPLEGVPGAVTAQMESQGLNFLQGLE